MEPPPERTVILADNPIEYMHLPERSRARGAANKAKRLYPGPPGEVLAREILTWEEMGWRLGPGLVAKLINHIYEQPEAAA